MVIAIDLKKARKQQKKSKVKNKKANLWFPSV